MDTSKDIREEIEEKLLYLYGYAFAAGNSGQNISGPEALKRVRNEIVQVFKEYIEESSPNSLLVGDYKSSLLSGLEES